MARQIKRSAQLKSLRSKIRRSEHTSRVAQEVFIWLIEQSENDQKSLFMTMDKNELSATFPSSCHAVLSSTNPLQPSINELLHQLELELGYNGGEHVRIWVNRTPKYLGYVMPGAEEIRF